MDAEYVTIGVLLLGNLWALSIAQSVKEVQNVLLTESAQNLVIGAVKNS